MFELQHSTLNATLAGVDSPTTTQFKGIQYATIEERFALPQIRDDWGGQWVGCTNWGWGHMSTILAKNLC